MINFKTLSVHAVLSMVLLTSTLSADDRFSEFVDQQGNIEFPNGFRDSMVHLGSWFVPEGGASGFHGVYTEKATIEAFRNNGKFPDGATLVKELRVSAAADYTTGQSVSHETTEVKQWFVMIKDTRGRFNDNPMWGDGWGWALYKPDNTANNVATDYKNDCLGCHVPARETDWVYTEAYPTLDAK